MQSLIELPKVLLTFVTETSQSSYFKAKSSYFRQGSFTKPSTSKLPGK